MDLDSGADLVVEMIPKSPSTLAHLELHTGDRSAASAFYRELLGWRAENVEAAGREYLALDLGNGLGGGIVECGTERALWLPYVSVPDIRTATERAERLGARVLLEPREGPAGWRSVVAAPDGGEIAFWQSKGWAPAAGSRPPRTGS
jgi:predicted enzyme related to lactoylglutathione lyase